jgi:hypothetical protein
MRRLAVAVFCAVLTGGCLFDNDSSPPALDLLWPNADHSRWDFQLVRREWNEDGVLYLSPSAVPPAPSIRDIATLVDSAPIGELTAVDTTLWRFEFDGTITTESGAVGQRVLTEIVDAMPAGRAAAAGGEFWRRLAIARPDLRERIAKLAPQAVGVRGAQSEPVFLDGYAWVKTPAVIAGFGDLDQELSWLYLDAQLRPGHAFTLALVPSLAADVFLHGLILPRRSVITPAGEFTPVVCVYLIDYGVLAATDASGIPFAYWRNYDYGLVGYAPGVGPVFGYERRMLTTGLPASVGQGDLTLRLSATGGGATAPSRVAEGSPSPAGYGILRPRR